MLTEISRMCNIYKSCVNIIILQVDIIYHACRGQKYATKGMLSYRLSTKEGILNHVHFPVRKA